MKIAMSRVKEPSWRRDFAASVLRTTLLEGISPALFELGIPAGKNTWQEALRRFKNYFQAPGVEAGDLREWLLSVALPEDVRTLREASEEIFSTLVSLVDDDSKLSSDELQWIRRSLTDAVFSLSLELDGLLPLAARGDLVIRALDFQIVSRRASIADERVGVAANACQMALVRCSQNFDQVSDQLSHFEFDKASIILNRIQLLMSLLTIQDRSELPSILRKLITTLAEGALADRDVRSLLRARAAHASHELADRMGHIGEKYIARSAREYFAMFHLAGGAGFITAGTIVAKYAMASLGAGLFWGGALASVNYTGSFLLMQLLGFRLATKQPSLTASALINRMKTVQLHSHKALSEVADEIATIARSQVAAAVGNFGFVIPAAVLFHFGYRWIVGESFLSQATALHAMESLNPFTTLTIPYAVFTGVLLWFSTLMASFIENWAIRAGLANRASKTIFGMSSCVFLGILLAVTPVLGTWLGYSIDVRHFTLSTGSLTFAVCSLGFGGAMAHGLLSSFFGVLVIGVLNFGVSFALSLTWSALASGVRRAHLTRVFGMALRFRGFPAHFFLPSEVTWMGFLQRR
jgi:site-specific recombinase